MALQPIKFSQLDPIPSLDGTEIVPLAKGEDNFRTTVGAIRSGLIESVAWGEITGTLADQTDLQAALDTKLESVVAGTNVSIDNTDPLNPVINVAAFSVEWGDIGGTLSNQTDLQNALNTKEPTINAGTTAQYWRGDKSWQTLNKTAVGLANVDNTSDANKPISTATQTALNLKANDANVMHLTGDETAAGDKTFTGAISSDTDTIYVDKVNHRLGVRTSTPLDNLHVSGGHIRLSDNFGPRWGAGGLVSITGSQVAGTLTFAAATNAIFTGPIQAGGKITNVTDPTSAQDAATKAYVDTAGGSYQPLDPTLTALAAYNTNGIMVQTAADTFAGRTITGTANQVLVTNGNGVSGNPTLSLPQDVGLTSLVEFGKMTIHNTNGSLVISATTDGGDFNISHAEPGAKTLAIFGSGASTMNVSLLDGTITATNLSGTNTGDQTAATTPYTPTGGIAATNVQTAINELDTEKANDSGVVHLAGAETITGLKEFQFTGKMLFDDPTFVIDSTNNRVGIGTNSPDNKLTIMTAGVSAFKATNTDAPSAGGGSGLVGGVSTNPTAAGDRLGFFLFHGANTNTAGMSAYATEAWSGSARGTYLNWEITNTGTAGRGERMRLGDNGLRIAAGAGNARRRIEVVGDALITGDIYDTNDVMIIDLVAASTAVNRLSITNAATTASPIIGATGSDTNIGITITPKGTGTVAMSSALTINAPSSDALTINGTGSNNSLIRFKDDGTTRAQIYTFNGSNNLNVNANANLVLIAGNATTPKSVTMTPTAMTFDDVYDIAFSPTTGTKIGTATNQKIGLWNATPVVQPTAAIAAATRVGGGGTALTDSDTFDGYTLAQIVKALRDIGILA